LKPNDRIKQKFDNLSPYFSAKLYDRLMPLLPPLKPKNQDRRVREFLYPHEITALIEQAKSSRNPQRDSTLLLLMFCHALQPIEVTSLQWQHVNFAEKMEPPTLTIYRNRRRGAYPQEFVPDIHILSSTEVKFLRQLAHEYKGASACRFLAETP